MFHVCRMNLIFLQVLRTFLFANLVKPVAHWMNCFTEFKNKWYKNIRLIRQKLKFNYMVTQSHESLKETMVKSQSVCDCSTQNLKLKFVLKGMQQSMQRIFMEKKTTKNKDEMTWVNRNTLNRNKQKRKKRDKLQSGKQCSGML